MKNKLWIILAIFALLATAGGCIPGFTSPTIVTFEVLPQNVIYGQSANLVWSVNGAETVIIEPGIGQVASTGSYQVSPQEQVSYTLTASNRSSSISKSVTLNVTTNITIIGFSANPSSVSMGESSNINWNVSGATNVSITPDIGQVALSGNRSVSPSDTTTYTLTASAGQDQKTATTTVTVNKAPIITSFTANPDRLSQNQRTTLKWKVTGATRVRIEPDIGDVPAAGSRSVAPTSSTTYLLIAESDCCVVTDSVDVQVANIYPPKTIPSVLLFNITPSSMYKGSSATLQWQVYGADTVQIDHGIGVVPSIGSIAVAPTVNTVYQLTAYNAYGYRIATVGITVFKP